MFSILILAFAGLGLVKFGIAQWRAIWIGSASQPLSDALQTETGIDGESIGSRDFGRLMDLSERLCPAMKENSPWLKEVGIYYRYVAKIEETFRLKVPAISTWAGREMQICSRYVAVMLDQNLSMNFDRQLATRAN